MNSTEKVVRGLELCLASIDEATCPEECPFYEKCQKYDKLTIFQPILTAALEELKRHTPMRVVMDENDKLHYGRCPACNSILTPWRANFCSACGQAVTWNEGNH